MVEYCRINLTKEAIFLKKVFKVILGLSLILNVILLAGGAYVAYSKGIFKKSNTAAKYPMNYYIQKSEYDYQKISNKDIEFFGDSLTDYGQWSELFGDSKIVNRGISGDDTERLLNRIDEIGNPSKLFIMAGTNDLVEGKSLDSTVSNYDKIIATISKDSPDTKIYIQSVLPFNSTEYKKNYPSYKYVNSKDILLLNDKLKGLAQKYNATFIDLYHSFANNDSMDIKYTVDGVHLTGEGYNLWKNTVEKYVSE
jgi:lysophospholipase L1-like esterase